MRCDERQGEGVVTGRRDQLLLSQIVSLLPSSTAELSRLQSVSRSRPVLSVTCECVGVWPTHWLDKQQLLSPSSGSSLSLYPSHTWPPPPVSLYRSSTGLSGKAGASSDGYQDWQLSGDGSNETKSPVLGVTVGPIITTHWYIDPLHSPVSVYRS